MWFSKTFDELTNIELYEILHLRCEVFVVEQQCIYEDVDGLDPACIHVGYREDELLAYARIILDQADMTRIGRVLVKKTARGKGLATELMQRAIAIALTYQKPVKISAQLYLEAFYAGLGFVACSEPYDEDGIMHLDMILARE